MNVDRLDEPLSEQGEPVAWMNKERNTITWDKLYTDMDALYTTPQTKEWVSLTAAELNAISDRMRTWNSFQITDVYFAIETLLKELNGYE